MSEEKKNYEDASRYRVECVVPGYNPQFPAGIDFRQLDSNSAAYTDTPPRFRETFENFIKLYQRSIDYITKENNYERTSGALSINEIPDDSVLKEIRSMIMTLGERVRVGKALDASELVIEGMSLDLTEPCTHMTFKGIKFVGCKFKGKLFLDSRFLQCKFIDCEFVDAEFEYSSFEACEILKCAIYTSKFLHCHFSDLLFQTERSDFTVSNSAFTRSKFKKSNFISIFFKTCNFAECEMQDVIFKMGNYFCNDTAKSIYENCNFESIYVGRFQYEDKQELPALTPPLNTSKCIEVQSIKGSLFIDCEIFVGFYCNEIYDTQFIKCRSKHLFLLCGVYGVWRNGSIFGAIADRMRGDLINLNSISFVKCTIESLMIIGPAVCQNWKIVGSEINKINFKDFSPHNFTFDYPSFQSITQVANGYKAVNGIVFQKVLDRPNFVATLLRDDRVDSGIGDDADTVVGNLSHSRHLYGVYLSTVAIGLAALLKSYFPVDFKSLSEFPFVGKLLDLELIPLLYFVAFPGIILLMVASFVNEARRWLPFINKRKEVTKVTGFSWTITQYIEPHPLKGTERSWFTKYVKEFFEYPAWYSKKAVSLFIRSILIFCGPAVFTGLVYRCWDCTTLPYEDNGTVIMTYHVVSLVFLWAAAVWLFILSNQFQRPLAFNPDADSTANPTP